MSGSSQNPEVTKRNLRQVSHSLGIPPDQHQKQKDKNLDSPSLPSIRSATPGTKRRIHLLGRKG